MTYTEINAFLRSFGSPPIPRYHSRVYVIS